MLVQFQEYLTLENIYLFTNFFVLPFWFMIIIIPNSRIAQILINSIIIPLILSSAYIYVIYQIIILDESSVNIFSLYLDLDSLYTIFSIEGFLLVFWIHFVALNLFLGSWVARDAFKYNIPRGIAVIPLILIYFAGPVGLVLYWLIRVFYAKRLGFHD